MSETQPNPTTGRTLAQELAEYHKRASAHRERDFEEMLRRPGYLDPDYDDGTDPCESEATELFRRDVVDGRKVITGFRPGSTERMTVPPDYALTLQFDADRNTVDDGRGFYLIAVRVFDSEDLEDQARPGAHVEPPHPVQTEDILKPPKKIPSDKPFGKNDKPNVVTVAWMVMRHHGDWASNGIPPHLSFGAIARMVNEDLQRLLPDMRQRGEIDADLSERLRSNKQGRIEISQDSIKRALRLRDQ